MIYRGRKVLDGPLDAIRQSHGVPLVRVRMAGGSSLPDQLPGVVSSRPIDGDIELTLDSELARPAVLQRLIEQGDVEHFETVRPRLHDIFVRLAQPESETQPTESNLAGVS